LDFRFWIFDFLILEFGFDSGFSIFVFGLAHRPSNFGFSDFDFQFWIFTFRFSILDFRFWIRYWELDFGLARWPGNLES